MILQLLNVLIGLTLVYLIFSTIASALFELAEGFLRRRGRLLARGVEQLLARTDAMAPTGGSAEQAVQTFYQHPLINSLYEGDYQREGKQLPSYIPPERFAQTVLMLAEDAGAAAPNDRFLQLRTLATRLAAATAEPGQPAPTPVQALSAYFKQSMDRVSGWFGRYARGVLLVIGFALALGGNIDTLRLVRVLAMDPVLADRIAESAGDLVAERRGGAEGVTDDCLPSPLATPPPPPEAESVAKPPAAEGTATDPKAEAAPAAAAPAGIGAAAERPTEQGEEKTASAAAPPDAVDQQLCQLKKHRQLAESLGLPIGWNRGDYDSSLGKGACAPAFWLKLFGLALTALALSFGATFWFDLLNQLVSLRATLKPADKPKADDSKPAAGGKAAAGAQGAAGQ